MTEKSVSARHTGGMRFELATGSGHAFVLDDGESDTGPRPTETLLASLVACTAMDIASLLVKKRQAFAAYTVEARGVQQAEYPQVYTWIDLVHVLDNGSTEVLSTRCGATPALNCVSVSQVGSDYQITGWVDENGGFKGMG